MSDQNDAPATADAEDDLEKIWAELAARDRSEDTDPDQDGDFPKVEDSKAVETPAAETTAAGEEGNDETDEDAGEARTTPDVEAEIKDLEHKVSSEEGRVKGLERKDRHEEASRVRHRVQSMRSELAALKQSRTALQAPSEQSEEEKIARQEFPTFAQSLDTQRQSQDAALAAREKVVSDDFLQLVRDESRKLSEVHPDYNEVVKTNAQKMREFVNSGDLKVSVLEGLKENFDHVTNAASATAFMDAFKEYLAAGSADTADTAAAQQTGKTKSDPPPPDTQAAAATDTPSGVSNTSPETNALQAKRQRQKEGAASTSTPHPAINSGPPSSGSIEDDWEYFRRLDRAKGK